MTDGVDLASVLAGIRTGIDEALACVDGISTAVEAASATLASAASGGVRADVAELRRAVAALDGRLAALIAEAGDPAGLRAAGQAWVRRISAGVSRLIGTASADLAQTGDRWTGAAADAYRGVLPAQQAALSAIVATGLEIDAILTDLAGAITRFWIAIGTACLVMVFALATALAAAGTLVGAPVAAATALAGVGALVAAGNSALSGLTDLVIVAAARGAALERRLADHTAFPLGAWPRSTTLVGMDAGGSEGDGGDGRRSVPEGPDTATEEGGSVGP